MLCWQRQLGWSWSSHTLGKTAATLRLCPHTLLSDTSLHLTLQNPSTYQLHTHYSLSPEQPCTRLVQPNEVAAPSLKSSLLVSTMHR